MEQNNNTYVGQTNINTQNRNMTVIEYINYNNITVKFDDGVIRKNKHYGNFKRGRIAHPDDTNSNHIGETNTAKNGLLMTIIDQKDKYLTIQFEDNTIVKNKTYNAFNKGNISHPTIKTKPHLPIQKEHKNNRIGETSVNNQNIKMTIIDYIDSSNCTIQFENDEIRTNIAYMSFKNKTVKSFTQHIGETNVNKQNIKMSIIEYNSTHDCTIQFETGEIKKNISYACFKKGTVANNKRKLGKNDKSRIGETKIAKNGMQMTIVAYRRADDIDILFEDETLVTHKKYGCFVKGTIKNPNIGQKHIGETNIATNGQTMTIADYRLWTDIDILFDDGTLVKNKTYGCFLNGTVLNPNYTQTYSKQVAPLVKERMGETRTNRIGMKATIVEYKKTSDLTVRFEDGQTVNNVHYNSFKKGIIKYPKQYQTIRIIKLAYHTDDKWAFYVKCKCCGLSDIMTYAQMQVHKCCQENRKN